MNAPRIHTLSNGLRVVIDPMAHLESAALGVWARVGSSDERLEEHGLAHLLEHMAFKGTKRRTARQLAEEIESVGGYLNAATSHQRTGYYVRVLKEDIGLGLDILSDILINPTFAEDEFAREKEVVIQEIGEAADLPDDVVFEALQAISWGDHPLARPILGTPESVRDQTTTRLREFMRRGYQPAAMVVAIAGKVDEDAFLKEVEAAFGGLPAGDGPEPPDAPAFHGGVRHDPRDIEQTHFAVAFEGVSSLDDDVYASRVLADILGGGMSSRLFQRVREEQGLAYTVYAFSDSYDACGLVGAYAGADASAVPEIAAIFRGELEALASGVPTVELDRARAMLRASIMMGFESPATRIESAAGQTFRDGKIMTAAEVTARLEAVTAEDVMRCARRALNGPVALSMVGAGDIAAAQQRLEA